MTKLKLLQGAMNIFIEAFRTSPCCSGVDTVISEPRRLVGNLCSRHYQPVDRDLGYCWKCLAGERDPPHLEPSWWWSYRGDAQDEKKAA